MVDAATSARSSSTAANLNVVVHGKLVDQRRNEGVFYSTVLSPAADQFSQPEPFEIRSSKSLGNREEIITVPCRLFGFFRKSYETKPDRHGETRVIRPVVAGLEALEN
ncbi:hypothetical protein NRB_06620 [Novosphingobium sp. 11B]